MNTTLSELIAILENKIKRISNLKDLAYQEGDMIKYEQSSIDLEETEKTLEKLKS